MDNKNTQKKIESKPSGGTGRIKGLAINVSPSHGEWGHDPDPQPFLEGMNESGSGVNLVYAGDLIVNPCEGCISTRFKTPGRCLHEDDMRWRIPKLNEADIHLLASPAYGPNDRDPLVPIFSDASLTCCQRVRENVTQGHFITHSQEIT